MHDCTCRVIKVASPNMKEYKNISQNHFYSQIF